jgi:plasmid stabilization system protein ParE
VKEAIFHPEARAEADGSLDFYEARLHGLGLRFLAAVEQATERISASPDAGAPLPGGYRKRIVPGFPYSIIYRVWADYVYVVAVAHQHQRPGYWRERGDRR